MTKQMLSICLAFVLLLGTLAGCSKNKTKTDNSSQNTQQETCLLYTSDAADE